MPPTLASMIAEAIALALACSVTDGDTIRCGDERIRITGIDAPETRACRQGRQCVEGDGQAATRTLENVVSERSLSIIRLGRDRYGRTLAVVYADGSNIACAQLAAGQAHYVARWDNRRLVAADCPDLAVEQS
ncbi:thermonuclease family protein [Erythrobacter alti]|uniref:thermonuclease family protein n=1 Tax=Erythrobacter alti TaxID=1896145 RepID=UPI0030F372AA